MCGIAGVVSDRSLAPDDRDVVIRMLERLAHRGPDGRGLRTLRTAVLGHTRLAIIDPEEGAQPIGNEDGSIWIVANCEIYNYKSLRSELESRGHVFQTGSDAETILHLYEEMGVACTDRLRGMFAFAIRDERQRSLLLARDPLGVKPLYYASAGSTLVFASTLEAVLEHPAVRRDVAPEAIHDYLTYHYVPSPKTILRHVAKLRPAERLLVSNGVAQTQRYWDIAFEKDRCRTDAEWLWLVRDGLSAAVESHLVADVPVGAFLSGGLDSGAIVACMSGATPQPAATNTVGFLERQFDERTEARALAVRFGTDHEDHLVSPNAIDASEIIAAAFDEPFADPSAIPTYYASRMARRRVKAVLSGDGGDELFAGYTRYLRHHQQRSLRRFTMNGYVRSLVHATGVLGGPRVRAIADNLTSTHLRAHYLDVAWFDPASTLTLFSDDFREQLNGYDPFGVVRDHFAECMYDDPLSRSQYVDLKTWLADGVLCKADRASMACGLEVRVPMLDRPFVETVARLPEHLKIRHGQGKFALRRAFEPVLGEDVAARSKRGFEVPLDEWFEGPLRAVLHDTVLSNRSRIGEWLDIKAVDHVRLQLQRGRRGIGARLWALLMLELWCRRVLPRTVPAAPAFDESAEPALVGAAP
jgi:asparagine synthase (glutamine-hydrolysing)